MKEKIAKFVKEAIITLQERKKFPAFDVPQIEITYAKDERFGDYTTNIAMTLAAVTGEKPMEIAEKIKREMEKFSAQGGPAFGWEKVEVAPPGYINFYLSEKYLQGNIAEINRDKSKYGSNNLGEGKKVLVEFISANPTGPIHLGNGRGGPLGDTLANVLEKAGFKIAREFYVNDFGNQVAILGHSVLKDNDEAQYKSDYVDDLSKRIPKKLKDPKEAGIWAAGVILEEMIKPTCEKLGINFDSWFLEKKLHGKGKVEKIIDELKEKGFTYEKDRALWFCSTKFGDDKDRVLVKADGEKTYIAADLAYHRDKLERGYDKMINIQGADHYKEAEVVRSFVENILGEKGKLETILTQFVRVLKDGKEVKMSKRRGVYFALDDLIEEVGKDAVRFIFLSYAPATHVNFDINLAKERSEKNPVYYVQYAHARISSILRKFKKSDRGSTSLGRFGRERSNLKVLTHEKELSLMRELNKFPELVEEISQSYEVHKLPHYAIKLADKFHAFYESCRVIDENNLELTSARLNLVNAVRIVLAEALRLMGVGAPEKM